MKPGTKRILKKFLTINTGRMQKTIDVIAKNSGKSKLYIYWDMAWNFLKYRMGYTDYFRCNFIDRTEAEKKTYVTAKSFYNVIHHFNDQEYVGIFKDKLLFCKHFNEYLGREWLNLKRHNAGDLGEFLKKHPVIFAKDPFGEGGKGISRIVSAEVPDVDVLYAELTSKGQWLVEEGIVQCKELDEVNPNVVNSFRVLTLVKDGKAYLLNNALRMNQGSKAIIGCSEDLYCFIDEKGKVASNVVDDFGNIYTEHPLTGKKFSELELPHIQEAYDLCLRAALEVPHMRYIGWDIAFTDRGPLIVEGNEYPGYGLVQYYLLKGSRTGHLEEIRQIVGDEVDRIKPA